MSVIKIINVIQMIFLNIRNSHGTGDMQGHFMKLQEWLSEYKLPVKTFAQLVGVTEPTMRNILNGGDTHLSFGVTIEEITNGMVKCKDLVSDSTQERLKTIKKFPRFKRSCNES